MYIVQQILKVHFIGKPLNLTFFRNFKALFSAITYLLIVKLHFLFLWTLTSQPPMYG